MTLRRLIAALAMTVVLAGACSSEPDEPEPEDPQAFCLRLGSAVAPGSAVNQIDLADPASIDAAIVQLGEIRDDAPPSVAADVAAVVDAFTLLVEALELPDNRTPAEVIAEQAESLDAAAQAGERLEAYSRRECGVDLAPPPPPTPTVDVDEDLAPA